MTKILAIETAGPGCSAALWVDGEVEERFELKPRGHSELILGMMQRLLAQAGLRLTQLDALGFSRGPGSFTGVRIATGVIQGAAFAAELPVVPVSTLAALAQGCCRETAARRILCALDARMGELYWGAYGLRADGLVELIGREQVAPADEVELPEGDGWHGVGSGWAAFGDALARRMGPALEATDASRLCRARDVVVLAAAGHLAGHGVSAAEALPVYLRDRVATPKR